MSKIIIYQVFTRLFGNRNTSRIENGTIAENGCGKLNDFDKKTLDAIRHLGVSHIWYTGVIRHATQTDYSKYGIPTQHPAVVKGKAGSPYAICDYYDIDPDLATRVDRRMHEFEQLVKRTHAAGLKMIIDFVPNHVARQYQSIAKPEGVVDLGQNDDKTQGFSPQNNFYYCPGCHFAPSFSVSDGVLRAYEEVPAKATGNDHFDNAPGRNDWYETVKLNYGVDYYAGRVGHFDPIPDTWHKMLHILRFWAAKGIDGFRCDMAEMVPAEFWAWVTRQVKEEYPDLLFIGEVYNPAEYRRYIASGFDYLYDKVGMYDTLRHLTCSSDHVGAITGAWQAVDDIANHMLYFLENHDEQRIASSFFAGDGLKAVPALVTSVFMRQNPFMLYAGEEYGERGMDHEGFSGCDGRTTIFDYWNIDTLCRAAWNTLTADEKKLFKLTSRVLQFAQNDTLISEGDFFDLMYANPGLNRQYAFLRHYCNALLLVVANFDGQPADVNLTIPAHAFEFLGLDEKQASAVDVLTGAKMSFSLLPDQPLTVHVDGFSAVAYKMNCHRRGPMRSR